MFSISMILNKQVHNNLEIYNIQLVNEFVNI